LSPKCYYKGSWFNGKLDLTPRAAALLGHDGWERVEIRRVRGIRIPRKVLLRWWGNPNV
jgi:hypothetical protein